MTECLKRSILRINYTKILWEDEQIIWPPLRKRRSRSVPSQIHPYWVVRTCGVIVHRKHKSCCDNYLRTTKHNETYTLDTPTKRNKCFHNLLSREGINLSLHTHNQRFFRFSCLLGGEYWNPRGTKCTDMPSWAYHYVTVGRETRLWTTQYHPVPLPHHHSTWQWM